VNPITDNILPFLIFFVAAVLAFYCLGVKLRQDDPAKREWHRIKGVMSHSAKAGVLMPVLIVFTNPELQTPQNLMSITALGLLISASLAVGILLGYLSPPRWFRWIDLT